MQKEFEQELLTDKEECKIDSEMKQSMIHRKRRVTIILILVALCLLAGIGMAGSIGMSRLRNAYTKAENEAYNNIYNTAYKKAEAANHVSNHALISVEDVKEISRLEVLTVQGSEFIIKNADENNKIVSCLEVNGTGVFTVNLAMGEFITDSERAYVLVRVPKPALTEVTVSGTGKSFWKDNRLLANGSVKEGVDLSMEQLGEGKIKLENSMRSSRRFHEESQKAAVRIITSLVQGWNPNIPELQVEVEFIGNDG